MRMRAPRSNTVLGFYLFYVALLTVILLIWVFSFFRMMQIVEQDAIGATLTVLAQGQQSFDEKLTNVSSLATRTMMNPTILRFMRVSRPLRDTDYELLRQCRETYASLTLYEPFMERSFVYFHESDTFLGDFGASARGPYVYEYQYRFGDMDFPQWLDAVNQSSNKTTLWPVMPVTSSKGTERYLPYFYTAYNFSIRSTRATMVALIPQSAIDECFDGIHSIGAEQYLLADEGGAVLYETGSASTLAGDELAAFLQTGQRSQDIHPQGVHKLVIRSGPSQFGITSIAVLDYSTITAKVAPLNSLFATVFTVAVVLGILLSIVFAYLSTVPMRRISRLVHDYLGKPGDAPGKIGAVGPSITNIIRINRDLAARLEDSRGMLRVTFMERLFQTGFDDARELETFAGKVGISLPPGQYAVIVFHFDTTKHDAGNNDSLERLFHIALNRQLSALPDRPLLLHTTALNKTAALFCWPDARTLHTFVEQNLPVGQTLNIEGMEVNLSIGVSNPFDSPMDTRGAYVEADFALDYIGREKNTPTFFSDIPGTSFALYYSVEKEMQLIRLVRNGDAAGAAAALRDIYRVNFEQSPISEAMQQQLAHDVSGTFIRMIDDVAVSTGLDMKPLYTRIIDLPIPSPMEQQLHLFAEVAAQLCDMMNTSRKNPRNAYIDRVLEYIAEHCTDVDLSLHAVADTFQLSQAYLSRQIRLQTNATFTELLEGHRMELAKHLATQTSMNITQIATQCGYSNANTFFKAFKRRFGTSPSAMRREHAAGR